MILNERTVDLIHEYRLTTKEAWRLYELGKLPAELKIAFDKDISALKDTK